MTVRSPHVEHASFVQQASKPPRATTYLKVDYVQLFVGADLVRFVKLAESSFAPDVKITVQGKRCRVLASRDLRNPCEGQVFDH